MAKSTMVTRRVILNNTYKVFEVKGLELIELDTIKTKGKIKESVLKEKYGKDKEIILKLVDTEKAVFGLDVDEFMKNAVRLK